MAFPSFKNPMWSGGSLSGKYGNIDYSNTTNEDEDKPTVEVDDKPTVEVDEEKKGGGNAAEIINATANGLDAASGLIFGLIGGGGQQTEQVEAPPTEEDNSNNFYIIGGFAIATLVILYLITKSNGATK